MNTIMAKNVYRNLRYKHSPQGIPKCLTQTLYNLPILMTPKNKPNKKTNKKIHKQNQRCDVAVSVPLHFEVLVIIPVKLGLLTVVFQTLCYKVEVNTCISQNTSVTCSPAAMIAFSNVDLTPWRLSSPSIMSIIN